MKATSIEFQNKFNKAKPFDKTKTSKPKFEFNTTVSIRNLARAIS